MRDRAVRRRSLLLLLQHQRGFLADRRRELLRDLGEQPRQRDFQAHVVIGDVEKTGRSLAERADIEREAVAGPGFLMERNQGGIIGARGREAGLDAPRRFLAAEPMRNGYDQRLRHACHPFAVPAPDMGSARTDGSSSRPPQRHCGALGTVQNPAQRAGTAFGDRARAEIATGAIRQQSTRSAPMRLKTRLYLSVAAIGVAGLLALAPAQLRAQTAVNVDADDIGGVVTGPRGPEAGVWVIAETTDLPTRYAKMVVTDDQGRYVVPDLPKAKYKVWVRGYGLVDSPKVDGEPGKQVNLTAVPAPNDSEAAKYYPAIYWYSMMKVPEASEFGKKDGEIPD